MKNGGCVPAIGPTYWYFAMYRTSLVKLIKAALLSTSEQSCCMLHSDKVAIHVSDIPNEDVTVDEHISSIRAFSWFFWKESISCYAI